MNGFECPTRYSSRGSRFVNNWQQNNCTQNNPEEEPVQSKNLCEKYVNKYSSLSIWWFCFSSTKKVTVKKTSIQYLKNKTLFIRIAAQQLSSTKFCLQHIIIPQDYFN
jgi:hypothetical protein